MQTQNCEIASVIHRFGNAYIQKHNPNSWQLRTLDALTKCRTAALGGHVYQCSHCGKEHISYNSCRNRHCPKCQSSEQLLWAEKRIDSVLSVKHFHIVFTIPEALNNICLMNSAWFYNAMFSAVWDTLKQFGYTHYGVESGAIAILHTWGQNLSLHPHIHCIVPAAGMAITGNLKHIGSGGKYLYPVRMLSVVFRAKFMEALSKHPASKTIKSNYADFIRMAWLKPWVVFCEPSFGKPKHVIGYLGQYIHRIAISNNRILKISQTHVTFKMKDYKDNAATKTINLRDRKSVV